MSRKASVDLPEIITQTLREFQESGAHYPCPETELIRAVRSQFNVEDTSIKWHLVRNTSIVRHPKLSGKNAPQFVVFTGDEHLIHKISENSVRDLLQTNGLPLSAETIRSKMGLAKQALASNCLGGQLNDMARRGVILAAKDKYCLPAKPRDLEIVETIGLLKQEHNYPVSLKNIAQKMPPPKLSEPKLKQLLDSMKRTGALQEVKIGSSKMFMFDGDDPRYARKADEILKLELLAEIEDLKQKLIEYEDSGRPRKTDQKTASVQPPDESVTQRILHSLDQIARRAGKRTVELWELRGDLNDVPAAALDQALQWLGQSRVLELKPVQDATKLSSHQRGGVLTLADGTMVLSVARLN